MKTFTILSASLLIVASHARGQNVSVPENRETSNGRQVQIRYAVLKATGTAAKDPLFYFVGGPGQSAIAETAAVAKRFAPARAERDLVFVDFRGMGESNGLDCAIGGLDDMIRAWHAADIASATISACASSLQQRADLSRYNTTEAVKDVDAVRSALGYSRISVMGVSYGTRAALEYVRRFPDNVSAVVLSSVLPPTHSARGEQAANAAASLEHVLRECEVDTKCAQTFPQMRAELDSVRRRLDRAPLRKELTGAWARGGKEITISRAAFEGALTRMLYTWVWARAIPAEIHDLYNGGEQGSLVIALLARQMDQGLAAGAWLSYSCTEDIPLAKAELPDLHRLCQAWRAGKMPADFASPVRSGVPALIISGTDDPSTPAAWGDEVKGWMPNSAHMVVAGWSHNPTPECATQAILQLLQTGSSAGLDQMCAGKTARLPFEVVLPKL